VKDDIRDMAEASLGQLRLVTSRYKPEHANSQTQLQYRLIAEEVAEIDPELVMSTSPASPEACATSSAAMSLNELPRQQRHSRPKRGASTS